LKFDREEELPISSIQTKPTIKTRYLIQSLALYQMHHNTARRMLYSTTPPTKKLYWGDHDVI